MLMKWIHSVDQFSFSNTRILIPFLVSSTWRSTFDLSKLSKTSHISKLALKDGLSESSRFCSFVAISQYGPDFYRKIEV